MFITDFLCGDEFPVPRAYRVTALLEQGYQINDLVPLIQWQIIEPWLEIDGVGGFIQPLGETLFVHQTRPAQEQIQALLLALQNPARQTFVLVPKQDIERLDQLNRQLTVDLRDVPLEQAIRGLFQQVDLSIEFDREVLQESGVDLQHPVTMKLPPISLKTALRLIPQHSLEVVPQSGQLVLTSREESQEVTYLAVYNVCDLCQESVENSAALQRILQESSSGPWLNTDGVGSNLTALTKPSVLSFSLRFMFIRKFWTC